MTSFLNKIKGNLPYDPAQVTGYNAEEIEKIERLYDIKVTGDFLDFMLDMGRCDGGLIGDDPIRVYRVSSVRDHIFFQFRLERDFKDYQIEEGLKLLKYSPFIFSVESETQYYFLATASEEPDRVWHYDENNETVEKTDETFLEYMQGFAKYYETFENKNEYPRGTGAVCCGELLIV